ncbi:MAG: hypothetical protein APF84_03145 [Gracilibacter sp. BRH_c7a]|nr:MAG: hypothetical protein APF84_03145 [Gracilibacter sp. BRH_c7a]
MTKRIASELNPNIGVLALGNLLRTDEGVGIHLLEGLREHLPLDVETLDGATSGLELLDFIERHNYLIVLDAVDAGQAPGQIIQWTNDQVPRFTTKKLSLHQMGFAEVLFWGEFMGISPDEIIVVGIQPQSLDWGIELTETIQKSVPKAIEIVLNYIENWKL